MKEGKWESIAKKHKPQQKRDKPNIKPADLIIITLYCEKNTNNPSQQMKQNC